MVICIAELQLNHRQASEVMAGLTFLRDTDATVQLHSLLSDESRGACNLNLCR